MSLQSKAQHISVSIIIPTHKFGVEFGECLKSIEQLSVKPDEVVVVFDGCMDSFENPSNALNVIFCATQKQSGPAAARNLGAQKATGDILFFVDSDVTLKADAIEQIVSFFRENSAISAIFGSYDNKPFAKNFISQYRNLMHHYVHQTSNEKAATFWGACGAIRRDAFIKVGGFDESFAKPSIEDIELGYRLNSAGFEIRLLKSLYIKHLKRWELKSLIMTDFFCRALPWSKLILKNKNMLNDLNLKVSNRLSVLLVFLSIAFLAVSFWLKAFVILAVLALLTVISINLPFYKFFLKNKGGFFVLKVVPLHLLYYLYSGVAFSISWSDNLFRAKGPIK
jgi:GT2 family glycosyltransferase